MADEASKSTVREARVLKNDAVFDALGNPMRRKIVRALARDGMKTARDLNPGGLTRPALLKHLSVLCDAGVVEKKPNARDARQLFYALTPSVIIRSDEKRKVIDFGGVMLPLTGVSP